MKLLKQTYREWWQVPKNVDNIEDHRQVTFLELFYDLVYVVLIAQLAHALSAHLTWSGIGEFIFMFIIIWWAWFNGAAYHDAHGNNDIRTRVFTFLQMVAVVAMAIFTHDAIGKGSVGFALSYAFFQLIMTILWWRTGVHDKKHAVLSKPYSAVFLCNTILFLISAFTPTPYRYYIWGFVTFVSLLLPTFILYFGNKNAQVQAQLKKVAKTRASLVERFGLFTIIVLGEVIVGVVSGVSSNHSSVDMTIMILGVLISIGMWWLYFDTVSNKLPKKEQVYFNYWYYLHLPMTIAITAAGSALAYIIAHSTDHDITKAKFLIVAATAVVLISVALLVRVVQHPKEHIHFVKISSNVMIISAIPVALLSIFSIGPTTLLLLLVLLLLTPVFFGFLTWIKCNSSHDHKHVWEK